MIRPFCTETNVPPLCLLLMYTSHVVTMLELFTHGKGGTKVEKENMVKMTDVDVSIWERLFVKMKGLIYTTARHFINDI